MMKVTETYEDQSERLLWALLEIGLWVAIDVREWNTKRPAIYEMRPSSYDGFMGTVPLSLCERVEIFLGLR